MVMAPSQAFAYPRSASRAGNAGKRRLTGGGKLYYSQDGLGSVRTLTDATGEVKSAYDYEAFGSPHEPNTNVSFSQRYTYTGREKSGVAGAPMYYRNRSYSPTLGRFGRRDPAFSPEWNLYGYVGNRPYSLVDPMGLAWEYDPTVDRQQWDWVDDGTTPKPKGEVPPAEFPYTIDEDENMTAGKCHYTIFIGHSGRMKEIASKMTWPKDCHSHGIPLACFSGSEPEQEFDVWTEVDDAPKPEGYIGDATGFMMGGWSERDYQRMLERNEKRGRPTPPYIGLANAGHGTTWDDFKAMVQAAIDAAKKKAQKDSKDCKKCCKELYVYVRCQPPVPGDKFLTNLNKEPFCNKLAARYKCEKTSKSRESKSKNR